MVLRGRLSKSSAPPLVRVIRAYRRQQSTGPARTQPIRPVSKWARPLSRVEVGQLAERYLGDSMLYELAADFGIDRRTMDIRLKASGVTMRRQCPQDTIKKMIRCTRMASLSSVSAARSK